MTEAKRAKVIGVNHISIEVGSINEAVDFYKKLIDFEVGDISPTEGSIEMGDQFIAFTVGNTSIKPGHFGLVVDDKELFIETLKLEGIKPEPGRFLAFTDPWGNYIEVVSYSNVKFTKAPEILKGMGITDLRKNEHAQAELEKLSSHS